MCVCEGEKFALDDLQEVLLLLLLLRAPYIRLLGCCEMEMEL